MKLHLGCFDKPLDGWHNTDVTNHVLISRVPFAAQLLKAAGRMSAQRFEQHQKGIFRKVHRLNVAKRFPFADNSVDAVFSSHIIEHLRPGMARHMMSEALRVLKPGGICRTVAPCLDHALTLYDGVDPGPMLKFVFQDNHSDPKNRHHWMYNGESLAKLMVDVGFENVEECEYQKGNLPDVERLDNRPGVSVYVEGVKGKS
ncbi:MAG: methyltransferase domain-containing protein [Verrucomicrobiota bacterium]